MLIEAAKRIPKLRLHKASGQRLVVLNRKFIYLGVYGKPGTEARYHKVVCDWLANGYRLPVKKDCVTILEILDAYWTHAQEYYVKGGQATSQQNRLKVVSRSLRELFGRLSADAFGPLKLKARRDCWIAKGLARKTCNDYTQMVKAIFKWAAEEELIDVVVYQRLAVIRGLRTGCPIRC